MGIVEPMASLEERSPGSPGPTVFYSKPWTVELHLELQRHWSAAGSNRSFEHLTQHLEVAELLESAGVPHRFLTREIAALDDPAPTETLARLEKRLRPGTRPFNRYRLAERYFEGRDPGWQLDQMARFAVWFDRYFAEEQPTTIIGNAPDELTIWLAFDIARHYGAQVMAMLPSVVPPNRLCILDDYAEMDFARRRFAELSAGGLKAADRERGARAQAAVPRGSNLSYLTSRTGRARLRRLMDGTFVRAQIAHTRAQIRERGAGNWHLQPTTRQWMSARVGHAIRARIADRRYLTAGKPEGTPFLFFPLHFQPEASTLIAGSYFTNQIEVVKDLARSVPIDWEVVVKEHFWMRGQRELSAYRDLEQIPNVRLVAFDVPTHELIEEAAVVSVVSGTSRAGGGAVGKGSSHLRGSALGLCADRPPGRLPAGPAHDDRAGMAPRPTRG